MLLFVLILGILPYLYLSNFTHPIADDYYYSLQGTKSDHLSVFTNLYFNWSGRYTTNLFELLNPMVWGKLNIYQMVPQMLLFSTIVGFFFLYHSFLNNSVAFIHKISLSVASTLIVLFQMPSIAEGIYWYTASIAYTLPTILFLFYLALLINYFKHTFIINKYFHFILLSILLIVIVGFNESIMLLILALHFIAIIKSYQFNLAEKRVWFILGGIAVISAVIAIFAPGNFVRASRFQDHYNIIHSLGYSSMQIIRFFFEWISNIPFVLGSVILIPAIKKLSDEVPLFRNSFFLSPLESSLLLIAIIFLCVFPAYWSTNVLGQHRTINTAYFFFILAWIVNLSCWVNYLTKKNQLTFKINQSYRDLFTFLIVFSLLLTKNGYAALSDIFHGTAYNFNNEMEQRYFTIKEAKTNINAEVELSPIINKPHTLFVLDLTAQSDYWVNRAQGKYFGIKMFVKDSL